MTVPAMAMRVAAVLALAATGACGQPLDGSRRRHIQPLDHSQPLDGSRRPRAPPTTIVATFRAGAEHAPLLDLAAREVRRYVYAATAELAPLSAAVGACSAASISAAAAAPGAVVLLGPGCAEQALAALAPQRSGDLADETVAALRDAAALGEEEHLVRASPSGAVLLAGGGSGTATLWAAYRYAELALGVQFGIGGDRIPRRSPAEHAAARALLPTTGGGIESPEFSTRGLNPFHDFEMGPDFWEAENYKAYTTQMSKLRMNFIGLHNYNYYNEATGYYSFSLRHSEPTVWQGAPEDVDEHGNVTRSYSSHQGVSWQSTCLPEDGVGAQGAARYQFGTDQLFGSNCHPERWPALTPSIDTEAAHISAYNYAKDFFASVFPHARRRGVNTGIGSEVPAMPPRSYNTTLTYLNYFVSTKDHFTTTGDYPCEYSMVCPWMCGNKGTGGAETQCTAPFDYKLPLGHHNIQSWVHTVQVPGSVELWTWYNGSTAHDGNTLLSVNPPSSAWNYTKVRSEGFIFPANATADQLPPGATMDEMYLMTIWASATSPGDLFAVSSPTLEALAAAAGFQPTEQAVGMVYARRPREWLEEMYEASFLRVQRGFPLDTFWLWTQEIWNGRYQGGVVGGLNTSAVTTVVEDFLAAEAAARKLNVSFQLATSGWTLGPAANRSYFDKILPEGWTLASIDETLGDAPVEAAYADVTEHPSWIIPWMEDDPHLGSTQLWVNRTLEHMTQAKSYGVSGALGITWRMEAVGPTIWALAHRAWDADLTASKAWATWATGEFGLSASDADTMEKFATALSAFEGAERLILTTGCPGVIFGCTAPASAAAYRAKILDFLHLQPLVGTDLQYTERWNVWSSLFKFVDAAMHSGCVAANYSSAAAAVRSLPTTAARAAAANTTLLPMRVQLVAAARNMTTLLLEATTGPGEMGMLATIHDTLLLGNCSGEKCNAIISFHENYLNASASAELADWLGVPALPLAAQPSAKYSGRTRIVMGAPRSSVDAGESLSITARVLSASRPTHVSLHYKQLSADDWQELRMENNGRGQVYVASIPAMADDYEYFVSEYSVFGDGVAWPPGAGPAGGAQTVVVAQW